jgi:dethiobiotin synthetase
MITWNGLSNFDSLAANLLVSGKEQSTVGLFLVCGSWNRPNENPKAIQDLLAQIIDSLAHEHEHEHEHEQKKYVTGILQVDASDNGLSTCFGDDDCQEEISFPCPPERLPALLFVGKRPRMPHPEIRYLQSLASEDILMYWKEAGPLNGTIGFENLLRELQNRLLFLGLSAGHTKTTTYSLLFPSSSSSSSSSSSEEQAIRIFIAGDRMSVGKTSVCLGLIGSLLQRGIPPESLAYIKPATQNESPQLVQRYCERFGIDCVPIGPVVYYRGFTRAFLAGDTESTTELLAKVETAVDRLAEGKRVVIIDGVGHPAVGGICGTDNASVARASGYPSNATGNRIPPGVLVVGGSGVGGAVDAFNLNATYFEAANVPVLGPIFNKLSLEGFYSLENCKQQITSYFSQNAHQLRLQRQAFGFVPMYAKLGAKGGDPLESANEYISIFNEHVDMNGILQAAAKVPRHAFPMPNYGVVGNNDTQIMEQPKPTIAPPAPKRQKTSFRPRAEIEQAAIQSGAAPSA